MPTSPGSASLASSSTTRSGSAGPAGNGPPSAARSSTTSASARFGQSDRSTFLASTSTVTTGGGYGLAEGAAAARVGRVARPELPPDGRADRRALGGGRDGHRAQPAGRRLGRRGDAP